MLEPLIAEAAMVMKLAQNHTGPVAVQLGTCFAEGLAFYGANLESKQIAAYTSTTLMLAEYPEVLDNLRQNAQCLVCSAFVVSLLGFLTLGLGISSPAASHNRSQAA
jgi:hypothetical protein